MKTAWKRLNPTKGWANLLRFLFAISCLIVSALFVLRFPQLLADLQGNVFGPILDIAIVGIAFTILIGAMFGSLVSGCGLGEIYGRVFDAALAAMVFMQRLSAQPLRVLAAIMAVLYLIFNYPFTQIIASHTPLKRLPIYPPPKLSPLAALPYELFPLSCTLLN